MQRSSRWIVKQTVTAPFSARSYWTALVSRRVGCPSKTRSLQRCRSHCWTLQGGPLQPPRQWTWLWPRGSEPTRGVNSGLPNCRPAALIVDVIPPSWDDPLPRPSGMPGRRQRNGWRIIGHSKPLITVDHVPSTSNPVDRVACHRLKRVMLGRHLRPFWGPFYLEDVLHQRWNPTSASSLLINVERWMRLIQPTAVTTTHRVADHLRSTHTCLAVISHSPVMITWFIQTSPTDRTSILLIDRAYAVRLRCRWQDAVLHWSMPNDEKYPRIPRLQPLYMIERRLTLAVDVSCRGRRWQTMIRSVFIAHHRHDRCPSSSLFQRQTAKWWRIGCAGGWTRCQAWAVFISCQSGCPTSILIVFCDTPSGVFCCSTWPSPTFGLTWNQRLTSQGQVRPSTQCSGLDDLLTNVLRSISTPASITACDSWRSLTQVIDSINSTSSRLVLCGCWLAGIKHGLNNPGLALTVRLLKRFWVHLSKVNAPLDTFHG